ncbi:ASFV G ACD 00190 [African swine fever virus]|nr:ASFV G ACD 00190 [African swine fever virus]
MFFFLIFATGNIKWWPVHLFNKKILTNLLLSLSLTYPVTIL